MKHVCSDCLKYIKEMGFPCQEVVDTVTTILFTGQIPCLCHCEPNETRILAINYLENRQILISTEVSHEFIAVLPNIKFAYINEFTAEVCWCNLFQDEPNFWETEN